MANAQADSRGDLLIPRKPVMGHCHMFRAYGQLKWNASGGRALGGITPCMAAFETKTVKKKIMVGVGQPYLLRRHVNEASGELMDYWLSMF